MTPRDREALRRIVAHIEKIESYLGQVGSGWPADDMAVDAIAKRLEDIGEQVKSIGADTLAAAPEVDWAAAKGLRTIIAMSTRISTWTSWSRRFGRICRA